MMDATKYAPGYYPVPAGYDSGVKNSFGIIPNNGLVCCACASSISETPVLPSIMPW